MVEQYGFLHEIVHGKNDRNEQWQHVFISAVQQLIFIKSLLTTPYILNSAEILITSLK